MGITTKLVASKEDSIHSFSTMDLNELCMLANVLEEDDKDDLGQTKSLSNALYYIFRMAFELKYLQEAIEKAQ